MKIRNVNFDDLSKIHDMVHQIEKLDIHHPYTYWVIYSSSPHLFFVAEEGGNIIGFVCGLDTYQNKDQSFLWQIGVLKDYRRKGVGSQLLEVFTIELENLEKKEMVYTITKTNQESHALFSSFFNGKNIDFVCLGETGSPLVSMKSEIIYSAKLSS